MKAAVKCNNVITTTRLPMDVRNRLNAFAVIKNKTKSQIIIDALELYYKQEEEEPIDSYKLGLPYFGKYNLGEGDLSVTYKERLKKILREKHLAQSSSY